MPGYEVKLVKPLPKYLECPICLYPMRDPIMTDCGHDFCRDCLDPILKSKTPICPLDKEELSVDESFLDRARRREILNLEIYCQFVNGGCNWIGQLKNLEAHRLMCEYRETQCTQCGQYIQYQNISKHEAIECPMRPEACPHCNKDIPSQQLQSHIQKSCPKAPHLCPNDCDSSSKFTLEELEKHLDIKSGTCPLMELKCPFSTYGCSFVSQRKNMPLHFEQNYKQHITIMNQATSITKEASDKTDYMYQKHMAAIEEAIKNKGKLDHTAMHGVFLGTARSGKSTLIKRLLKEEISQTSPSTGTADKVIHVSVKKSSSIAMSVMESKWFRLTYSSEAVRLMMLTAKEHKKQPQSSSSGGEHPPQIHPSTSLEMPAGYANTKVTFEEALRDGGILTLREHFDGSWTLYVSDTGGQMEFQEILPLLVSGHSLFIIVFPLNRDLDELFMIEYQLPDGERSQPYRSSLTLKDAILQSFSTISAMGTITYKGAGREHVEIKPKVLLVGTHKDMLEQSTAETKIKEIDNYLQDVIMSFFRDGLVEFATRDQLIFTVNNLADDDSDFARIRLRVNEIAKSSMYQMSIPTHWLIFSLVIRGSPDRVISYDECFQVAQQCGIDSEDELHNALWFLHTKMGVIRYFQHGDVSKIVIIDPQLLFDKITDLIINTFTFDKGTRLNDEFMKKGLFSIEDLSRINTTQDPLLTHLRFIDLLEHLRIVVPLPDRKRYLIPCVWTHADKALCPPKQHSAVPTLAIIFDCGYCPKGVTGSVVKYLMTNEMRSDLTWKLQTDQIFCDQATFFVGPSLITLCMYPTHFEVVYAPSTTTAEAVCSIQEICREVCQTLLKAIHTVSKDINLACRCEPSFYCTQCKSHIADLVHYKGIPCQLWCSKTKQFCDLPNGFHYWLEALTKKESEQSEPSTANTKSSSTLTLPSAFKLVFSLSSKWKNLGLFLNLDEGTLDKIQHDNQMADDRLREMLSAWLKKVIPPPSWEMLADAVDFFDQTVAAKIRETYCTS